MIIKNGLVWEESGSFRKKELVVDTTTHRIAETAEDDTVFDAEGLYVIPGLVDVHIHGARGHDFSDGNSKGLAEIAQYLHSCGVTSFCPTSMTLPEEQLTAAFATINDVPDAAGYAHIAGIHMEGPYLSPEKKGAQKASYLHAPDAAMFRRLSAASGNKIRIITIAPELPGSDAFIREFKDTVAISLGHSTASYEIAENAFAAGANHVTHLFNAMPTTPVSECRLSYEVFGDGRVKTTLCYDPVKELGDMPEFGVLFKFNADYDRLQWYGLGEQETYADRCKGAKLGIYSNKVKDNVARYMVPQECGAKCGVRWARVTNRAGDGMLFEMTEETGPMVFSALPYTPHEIENAMHPYELPPVHYTVVRVAKAQMGVGGDDSWGAQTHPEYLLQTDKTMQFSFVWKGVVSTEA